MKRAVVAVQSQELTEKAKDYMPRYVLKDRTTGKIVSDAQGGFVIATQKENVVKTIPKAEETGAGVTCTTRKGQAYRLTQNISAGRFVLWKVLPNGFQKIGQANSPPPLYEKIPWDK